MIEGTEAKGFEGTKIYPSIHTYCERRRRLHFVFLYLWAYNVSSKIHLSLPFEHFLSRIE